MRKEFALKFPDDGPPVTSMYQDDTPNSTGGGSSGTTSYENVWMWGNGVTMLQHVVGTQTLIGPQISASGLVCGLDLTDTDGLDLAPGVVGTPHGSFTVGTDPAFYTSATIIMADCSGTGELHFGFRKVEGFAAFDGYNDAACFQIVPATADGDFKTETILTNAGTVTTDITLTDWVDGGEHKLEVYVSAAGVVTYKIDGVAAVGAAAYSFTTALQIMPCLQILYTTTTPGAITLVDWDCGFQ